MATDARVLALPWWWLEVWGLGFYQVRAQIAQRLPNKDVQPMIKALPTLGIAYGSYPELILNKTKQASGLRNSI